MKRWALPIAVLAALVVLALVLRNRDRLPERPEDTITALFEAAEAGDDAAYLRLVAGDLRKSLKQTRSQEGTDAFCRNLKRSVSGIKGLAVARSENSPAGFVAIDVEIVYVDRIERQRMLLTEARNGWVITSIETASVVEPLIPYGTPVFQEEEESGE